MDKLKFVRDKLLKDELAFGDNKREGYVDGIFDMFNAIMKIQRMDNDREERETECSIGNP